MISVAICFDGTKIVSSSWDKTIRIWDAQSGQLEKTLEGHEGLVTSVAFSSDGTKIVSSSWDDTIRIWDAHTGALENTLEELLYSEADEEDNIIVESFPESILSWDSRSGKLENILEGHEAQVTSIAIFF